MDRQFSTKTWLFLICLLFFASCRDGREEAGRGFIFLGHAYDWAQADQVDPRLEQLEYGSYEQIWLGGDVCARTGREEGNMAYLDSLFGLRRVHWALGNHDYAFGQPERILASLGSPSFYTQWEDGFCLMVLNTNLFFYFPSAPPQENCAEKQAQVDMIRAVADTISQASHLVILHHHGLFNGLKVDASGDTIRAFNVNADPIFASCDTNSEVTATLYPWLVEVQRRGVQVVLIGGDVGMQAKSFEFETPEGIWMLGSGINNSVNREEAPEYVVDFGPDQVLLLEYQPSSKVLNWKFVALNQLLEEQEAANSQ